MITLLIINILVGIIGFSTQNNKVENQLTNLRSQVSTISRDIDYMSNNIHQEIDNALKQENNYIADFNFNYNYEEINVDKKIISVEVSFKLKEKQADSKIYLTYYKENEMDTTEVLVEQTDSLTYQTTLALSYDDNYTIDVIEKQADGGIKQLNVDNQNIWLQEQMRENRLAIYSEGVRSATEAGVIFQLVLQDYGIEAFDIETVEIAVMNEEQEIKRVDITNELSNEPIEAIGFGAEEEKMAKMDPMVMGMNEEQIAHPQVYYGRYTYKLDKEKTVDFISFHIMVTCKDGLVINEWS